MLYAMFAMVLLTFIVALHLFWLRYRAIKTRQVSIGYFRTNSGAEPPVELTQAARNYTNLFEMPVLFYAAGILALTLRLETTAMIVLAWIFVFARVIHSVIHLTGNNVVHRMIAFMTSVICVLGMWLLLLAATIMRSQLTL